MQFDGRYPTFAAEALVRPEPSTLGELHWSVVSSADEQSLCIGRHAFGVAGCGNDA